MTLSLPVPIFPHGKGFAIKIWFVSVAELFPGAGSVNPPGKLTLAMFVKSPLAPAEILAIMV